MPVVSSSPGAASAAGDPRRIDAGREAFRRRLMAVDRLPAAPEVATRTLALLERDQCSLNDLAGHIASDQAIATGLLRLANSAFFTGRGRISSLAQAVSRLGFSRVRDLVLGLSVWQSFDGDPSRRYTLWLHSALVAGVAKRLAERAGRDGPGAYTGGVVHDVGKLVLGHHLGETYWQIVDRAGSGEAALVAAELGEFGCHHGVVGGWLFNAWGLPSALVDAATQHHDAVGPGHRLDDARLVGLADRLIDATDPLGGIQDDGVFRDVARIASGLVTKDQWPDLFARVAAEQQAAATLFE